MNIIFIWIIAAIIGKLIANYSNKVIAKDLQNAIDNNLIKTKQG